MRPGDTSASRLSSSPKSSPSPPRRPRMPEPPTVGTVDRATSAPAPVSVPRAYPADKAVEYAQVIREMIYQENLRINERMSWLIQLHGFLFAALAFAWDKGTFLIVLLCGVGVCSSVAIGNSLRWAVVAGDRLEADWENRRGDYDGPPIIGLGKSYGRRIERIPPFHPSHTLPLILCVAWLLVCLAAATRHVVRLPPALEVAPACTAPGTSRPNAPALLPAPTPPAPRSPSR